MREYLDKLKDVTFQSHSFMAQKTISYNIILAVLCLDSLKSKIEKIANLKNKAKTQKLPKNQCNFLFYIMT